MPRSTSAAIVWSGLMVGGCGAVTEDKPPDAGREVFCNGAAVPVLENGAFDALDPPWTQQPPGLLCGQPRIAPDSGATAACLGGGADNSLNIVSREVFLPEKAIAAQLNGRICIDTDEVDPLDNDVLTIEMLDGSTVIGSLLRRTNQQGTKPCQYASFSVTAPLTADPLVATFRIQSKLDVGRPTSFYVDTLALTITCQ